MHTSINARRRAGRLAFGWTNSLDRPQGPVNSPISVDNLRGWEGGSRRNSAATENLRAWEDSRRNSEGSAPSSLNHSDYPMPDNTDECPRTAADRHADRHVVEWSRSSSPESQSGSTLSLSFQRAAATRKRATDATSAMPDSSDARPVTAPTTQLTVVRTQPAALSGRTSFAGSALSRGSSAPLMHTKSPEKPGVETWHSTSPSRPWTPAAKSRSSWRARDFALAASGELSHLRNDVDNGAEFVHGCVPRWNLEGNLRIRDTVGHDLTWAYYRMKRHPNHPLRTEVDDKCRSGVPRMGQFQFWTDLRPPFYVIEVRRDAERSSVRPHGEICHVVYACGIEYSAERTSFKSSLNGTFDSKVHGVATVCFPEGFPQHGKMEILSWGKPKLSDGGKASRRTPSSTHASGRRLPRSGA